MSAVHAVNPSHQSEAKPKKGPEFMALRFNVRQKRKELRKDIAPLENYLLDDITEATVNAWKATHDFDINEIARTLGTSRGRVYAMLSKLKELKIITDEKKYGRLHSIGLNPEFFGQILIDHQHDLDKKKHLSLAVDNSKKTEIGGPVLDLEDPKSDLESPVSDLKSSEPDLSLPQLFEKIEENVPIDSFRSHRSLRRKTGESLTFKKIETMTAHEVEARKIYLREQSRELIEQEKKGKMNDSRSMG